MFLKSNGFTIIINKFIIPSLNGIIVFTHYRLSMTIHKVSIISVSYTHLFYLEKVCKHLRNLFPKVVSYNRIVELEREVVIPLALFIKKVLLGKCTGISFVDSTPLRVCKNQRIHIHKVFKGIAQRGKCSMGWFFGFKLHLICNEKGELLNFMITPGDVDDRKPLEYNSFVNFIYGKLVGDKGYISKNLFQRLFVDGIQLITKLKSNMKGALMSVSDRLLLRKRAIIETVNDELKNIAQVEHSRHCLLYTSRCV